MTLRQLRLGIDLDGVVLDNIPVWADYFNAHAEVHGHRARYESPSDWGYFAAICEECLQDCKTLPDLLLRSALVPGAVEGLGRLRHRADLFLVSHRDVALQTSVRELLRRYGLQNLFCEWYLLSERQSKRTLCETLGLEVHVDDAPHVIEELTLSPHVIPIIFDQPYNRHVPGIRVRDWAELVARITTLYDERVGFS